MATNLLRPRLRKKALPLTMGAPGEGILNRQPAGAVEAWGRGTNRVIDECRNWGVEPPTFEEQSGAVTVTFHAPVGPVPPATTQVTEQVSAQVTAEVAAQVLAFCREPQAARSIMAELGLKHWKTFQTNYLIPLIEKGWLERTIPDKPRSRLQRYRITAAGRQVLEQRGQK